MTTHSLKLLHLQGRSTPWRNSPQVTVSVIQDRWTFDKGREIEFMAMGLPQSFIFIVDSKIQDQEGQRAGDCRAGSWCGQATRIGLNRYQGIQATGTNNEASGLIAFGTANSTSFGKVPTSNVSGIALGANIDVALGQTAAANVSSGAVADRMSFPEFGRPKTPNSRIRTLAFGNAVDQATKTIRSGPSVVRRAMYEFGGDFATTQFYPRYDSNDAVGGVTYGSCYTADYQGLPTGAIKASALPISEGKVSEKLNGDGRTAVWRVWAIAGAENNTPYKYHYLVMYVEADGTLKYGASTGSTPNSTNGDSILSEAYTIFSDDKFNTANNSENQDILKRAYYAAKTKSQNFTVKRPIVVPNAFFPLTEKTKKGHLITQSWIISADFINHEYRIGE